MVKTASLQLRLRSGFTNAGELTVSWLTDFTLLPLADDARELYLSGRRNRLTDG